MLVSVKFRKSQAVGVADFSLLDTKSNCVLARFCLPRKFEKTGGKHHAVIQIEFIAINVSNLQKA